MKELMKQIDETALEIRTKSRGGKTGFILTHDFYDSMNQYRTLQHVRLEMDDLGSTIIDRDFIFPIHNEVH